MNLGVRGSNPLDYPIVLVHLLHNFKARSKVFRWTPKKHLVWLLNNSMLFFILSIQMTLYNWHAVLNLTNKHFFQIIFKYGYKDLLIKQIVDSFPFRHYPVGLAFNSTIKYWILRKNINMLDNNPITNLIIPTYNNVIFNRYHRFPTFSLSRSTQNVLKIFLTRFRTFLVLSWIQWNNSFRIRHQHTYLLKDYHLFRFLNIYYAKLFNF